MQNSPSGDAPGAAGHGKAGLVIGAVAFATMVATPSNAIVFGSGHITIPQMVRAGSLLNLLGVAVITAFSYTVVMTVLGIEAGVAPDWALGGDGR